jgi:hypothetical protein
MEVENGGHIALDALPGLGLSIFELSFALKTKLVEAVSSERCVQPTVSRRRWFLTRLPRTFLPLSSVSATLKTGLALRSDGRG